MAKEKNFFVKQSQSPFFRDMRMFQDDKTVIENPHKGWYVHYVDNGARNENYRSDISSPEMLKKLPGTKFLYLRLDWSDIEKGDGEFDFSFADSVFEEFSPFGFKFIFRFCTFEAGDELSYATPKFVFDNGAAGTPVGNNVEPDYGDEIYLKYLERFLKACADKYDGNPLVEAVDIGTFGTWGEGHTWCGSMKAFPPEVIEKHIDLHVRCFKKTQLTLNYGMLISVYNRNKERAVRLAYACAELGMALRCDSVNVKSYIDNFGYDTLCSPDLYSIFNNRTPIDIEFEHYSHTGTPELFRCGYPHIEALRGVKATYAGFHGFSTRWIAEQRPLHEYLANRLGYWYFIEGFSIPPIPEFTHGYLELRISNRGFARAYSNYTAKVVLEKDGERFEVYSGLSDNTLWQPGEVSVMSVNLDLKNVPKGSYKILFGLFEGAAPVKFGMKNELFCDGYYTLGETDVY